MFCCVLKRYQCFSKYGPCTICIMECLLRIQIPGPHFRPPASKLNGGALGYHCSKGTSGDSVHTNVWEPLKWGVGKKIGVCFVGLKLSWEHNIIFLLSMTLANVHWFLHTYSLLNVPFAEKLLVC